MARRFQFAFSQEMKFVLTIAGSDSFGGAGIQADIKTIAGLGAHAFTVITAITAQNSLGISAIHPVPPDIISKQLETIVDDRMPDALKIGMLYSKAAVVEVAEFLREHRILNVVLDPIMRASTGYPLLQPEAFSVFKDVLVPLVRVVTPNLHEAAVLADRAVLTAHDMTEAAKAIKGMGPDVVITGGHLQEDCVDVLYDGRQIHRFSGPRIEAKHTHGSGCAFSTSLATFLSEEMEITKAVKLAHDYTREAILRGYACGHGSGAVRSWIKWPEKG